MLGQLPGTIAVGELGRIWDKGLLENQLCGCGLTFDSCPFWLSVGEHAFGGWSSVDGYEVAYLRESVRLKRRIRALPRIPIPRLRQSSSGQLLPFLLLGDLWPRYRVSRARYAAYMARLYDGIDAASGGALIIDSMKVPYHIFLARRIRGADVRIIHLVRDSRGVAYSNVKFVEKQSQVSGKRFRGQRHPAKTAGKWISINLGLHLARKTPTLRVRYEDAMHDPCQTLEAVARFAGLPLAEGSLGFIKGSEVDLSAAHLVAGNRVRLLQGPVMLREDDAWRSELAVRQQRLVEVLTWPLLRSYGYHREAPEGAPIDED
jgi:hypothetical protein